MDSSYSLSSTVIESLIFWCFQLWFKTGQGKSQKTNSVSLQNLLQSSYSTAGGVLVSSFFTKHYLTLPGNRWNKCFSLKSRGSKPRFSQGCVMCIDPNRCGFTLKWTECMKDFVYLLTYVGYVSSYWTVRLVSFYHFWKSSICPP